MDIDIGKIIREARQREHLTQYKLAEMLNVDPSTVCRWENNEKIPSGDTLIKLTKILNIIPELFPGYNKVEQSSEIPLMLQQELEKLWKDNEKLWQVVRLLERTLLDRKEEQIMAGEGKTRFPIT